MKFQGKVVLVTGASAGIGAATAIEYAREGAKVSITGRNSANLAKTAQKCREAGAKEEDIFSVLGDVTKQENRLNIVDSTISHFGHIDILINNAGYSVMKGIINTTLDDLEEMLNVHVKAVFTITQRALPSIIERKGAIVNVSSAAGLRPSRSVSAYSIAKAGMDQYTRILALEVADKGVRVNSVSPGIIATNILGDIDSDEKVYHGMTAKEALDDMAQQMHPNKRLGTPEEVAKSILFLSSEEVAMVSGVILPIDGARCLASPERKKID